MWWVIVVTSPFLADLDRFSPKWPWRSRSIITIFNRILEGPKIHIWCKFGDPSLKTWRVIVVTSSCLQTDRQTYRREVHYAVFQTNTLCSSLTRILQLCGALLSICETLCSPHPDTWNIVGVIVCIQSAVLFCLKHYGVSMSVDHTLQFDISLLCGFQQPPVCTVMSLTTVNNI